jgi:hypothetical protein
MVGTENNVADHAEVRVVARSSFTSAAGTMNNDGRMGRMPSLVGLGCVLLALAFSRRYGVPALIVALGSVLLAIALAFLLDGAGWSIAIAWLLGTWGATLVAWGLIAGWPRSVAACAGGSAFALAAVLVALLCVQRDAWEIAIPCALAGGLALLSGGYQIRALLQQRARDRDNPGGG